MSSATTNIRQKNKEASCKHVLNNIRKHSPVSRIDLCRIMKISKPTITNIVNELLERNLVIETGTLDSDVGRRRICLEINGDAGYSIGIGLTITAAHISLVDMKLKVRASSSIPITECQDDEALLSKLTLAIQEVIAKADIDPAKLLGISIACPGFVDYRSGVLLNYSVDERVNGISQRHYFENVRIKDYLEHQFQLPVLVENDANVYALGECWCGCGANYNNVLLVLCDEEVGSGIVSRGHILRGKMSLNHGIGHLRIDPNGSLCGCGRRGCVESLASQKAILRETAEQYEAGASTGLSLPPQELTIQAIGAAADQGDPLCCSVIKKAASAVGEGIAMLSGIVNPELVILTGSTVKSSALFYNTVVEVAKAYSYESLYKYMHFVRHHSRDNEYELNAAALVFRKYIY